MGSPTPQQFCLRWNNHPSALLSVFEQLLQTEVFTDVTIAIDGVFLKAHKLVLSACSPYFQMIFASHTSKHPIIILKDVHFLDMRALLDFMYRGEVSVDQERLPQFLRLAETLRIRGLAEVGDCTQQTAEGTPKNVDQHRSSVELDRQKGSAEPYTPSYSPFHPYQLSSPYPPETPQSPNDLLKRPGSPYSSYSSRRKRGRPPKLGSGIDYLTDPLEMLDVKVDPMASCSSYTPRHSSTPLTPQSTEGLDDENSRDYSRNRAASEEIVVKKEWTPPIEIQPGSSKEDSASTNHSGESNGDEGGQLLGGPRIRKPIKPGRIRVASLPLVKNEEMFTAPETPANETEQLQEMSIRGLNLFKYATVSQEGVYKCLPCEKDQIARTFKNKYSFQRHAYLYHEGNQRKVFPCLLCGREFSRPDKLKHHAKTVHDPQAAKEINITNLFHHMPASGILADGLPRIDSMSSSIDLPTPLALVTDRGSPH